MKNSLFLTERKLKVVINRSSRPEVFFKKIVLRNLAKKISHMKTPVPESLF